MVIIEDQGKGHAVLRSIDDRLILGPDGKTPTRMYSPKGNSQFPALVYFHGGLRREMGKEV